MTPETALKRQIRDYLRLKGWFVFHVLQGLGAYRGISDMIALKAGRVVFLEVKSPRGRQNDNQQKFQQDVEDHGGEYWLVRSLDDVIEQEKAGRDV